MATQSGITVAGVNEPYKVVHDLPRSKPGHKQVLVKSLVTAINPVEPFMHHTGFLATAWPAVFGCDASGVVLECGSGVTKFKPGDHAFGCTFVGQNAYSTFQETFLMDEDLAFKRGGSLTTESAATIGVGLLTASLALLRGTNISLPAPDTKIEEKDEWVIVLGASGGVGHFGVQIARLAGYKVLASCSASKASIPLSIGATATVNNRLTVDEQVAEIKKATGGKFARVFDASAYGYELAIKALETASTEKEKWFSSVDDWTDMATPSSIHEYRARLAQLGRPEGPIGKQIGDDVAAWIPSLEGHIERGNLSPLEYHVVDGVGWESVIEGVGLLESGKESKKIVVRVQEE